MSAVAAYRALLRIVGPAYVLVAFLGRIPLAMSQLGTLLLVSSATGRYALGGAAAGTLAVANAIGAPIAGALADRFGQRPVVFVQSWAGAAGLVGIVAVVGSGATSPLVLVLSAAAGLAIPQIGPLARVRWRPITRDARQQRRLVDAAFSYEGAADEASFVLGPALVGVLAALVDPAGALIGGAVLLAVFGSWFALHPTGRLVNGAAPPAMPAAAGRVVTGVFAVLVLAQACVGMIFGSIQTGATVLATEQGHAAAAGLLHAVLGVGSVIAGLAVATLPERIGYGRRMLAAAAGLALLSWPLLLVESVGGLVVVLLLLGFAVAPYMIGTFALAGQLVPPHRVGMAMSLLAGATGVGYAIGSSFAGRLADHGGYTPAFAVTVSAAVLAVVVSGTSQRSLRVAGQSDVRG